MVHALTRIATSVRHDSVAIGVETFLAGDGGGEGEETSKQALAVRAFRVAYGGHVPSGNDEHVHGRFPVDVPEGHGVVRSLHDLCWNLAGDNFAEQTIRHDLPAIWPQ